MLCLGQWPSSPTIPRTARTAPACPQPGPEKNWANAVLSSASLAAFFSFFTSSVHLCVVGLRLRGLVALTYAASVIVGLAAQQSGRPDLIRSPKRVLAHLWEGDSQW